VQTLGYSLISSAKDQKRGLWGAGKVAMQVRVPDLFWKRQRNIKREELCFGGMGF